MQDLYLICEKCNGYYKLKENESPYDFQKCQCGGDLFLVKDIDEYYEYLDYYEALARKQEKKSSRSKKLLILVSCLILMLVFTNTYYSPFSLSDSENTKQNILGSDNKGYVTKEIYQNEPFTVKSKVIAVVTGIHPREKLSKNVTSDVIAKYPLSSNLEIIHYDITVTNNPENYYTGRTNGEGLAADYILPDIKNSNCDLVIICHDHKPGYGSGFYIATPQMDEASVKLAELINRSLGDFKYYRADNIREHSSSAVKLSKPLASSGYKTLVYEVPEWENYNKSYDMTHKLLKTCFMFLN